MINIDSLLAQRNTHRTKHSGNVTKAQDRLDKTLIIAKYFQQFDNIRSHLFHPHQHKIVQSPHKSEFIIDFFESQGWIKTSGKKSWKLNTDSDLRFYLAGGWLEELLFFAHKEAGADEAYFGQQVIWDVNGTTGKNEIDVIARRGDLLSFTSCKTIGTKKSPKHMSQLRHFLTEADYWNIHFANDKGRSLLVTTADFIDELNDHKHRYPQLVSRSTVLDVKMAGLEQLEWDVLVETIRKHW